MSDNEFLVRERESGHELESQLAKCRLKKTIGWLGDWYPERTEASKEVPGVKLLYVYLDDPYSGLDDDYRINEGMHIIGLSDKQVAEMKYGQRIRFSGDLAFDGGLAVKNAKYELLDDAPAMPTPTANELEDLHIVLERTGGYGSSGYTITIASDGQVTFESSDSTRVQGTVTTRMDENNKLAEFVTATTRIGKDKLAELVKEFKKADFFSLSEGYYNYDITDAPSYRVSIQTGGRSKSVGAYAAGPRRLYILMNRIDQIVNSDQWVRCDQVPEPCP